LALTCRVEEAANMVANRRVGKAKAVHPMLVGRIG
jgi:hypothetical protein